MWRVTPIDQNFNRLGCCSSADTHDRFVTHHAMAQRQETIWNDIPSNAFTVASVDNFNILLGYSAVYCGDQQRSYLFCSSRMSP